MNNLLVDFKFGNLSSYSYIATTTELHYHNLKLSLENIVSESLDNQINDIEVEEKNYRYLLSGGANSQVKLWDLNIDETEIKSGLNELQNEKTDHMCNIKELTASKIKKDHIYGITKVKWWRQDNGMFITSSYDGNVKIWDTEQFKPVYTFDIEKKVFSFDLCGENDEKKNESYLIAVASDQLYIRLMDLRSGSNSHNLSGHESKTLVVKWHPSRTNILCSGGLDCQIKMWDVRRSNSFLCVLDLKNTSEECASYPTESVKSHFGYVNGLLWNETGTMLYSSGNDDKIRVWNMHSTFPKNELVNFSSFISNKSLFEKKFILTRRYETELRFLIYPSDDGSLFVFRALDGKIIKSMNFILNKSNFKFTSITNSSPYSATYYLTSNYGQFFSVYPDIR